MDNLALSDAPVLLDRPQPSRIEGPTGYLFRLAEANFMSLHDLEQLGIAFTPVSLELQRLLPPAALYPELHVHIQHIANLLHEHPGIWNHQHARYCPYCLVAEPRWRAGWEVLYFDTCPKHGVWLVDRCSSCGDLLTWQRDSLLRCNCGADLRQELPEEAPATTMLLAEALEQMLMQQVPPSTYGYPFHGLTIEQAQRLIRYLGGYLDPVSISKPLKIIHSGRLDVSWRVSSLAAEILIFWPEKFHQALDAQQVLSSGIKKSLNTVFKEAYHYLYQGGLRDRAFQPVRDAFQLWFAQSWEGGATRRNHRIPVELLQDMQWIPGKAAANKLGISMARLRYLIHSGQLEGQETFSNRGKRFLMVRKDQLPLIEEQLAGEITMTKAMEILGLGKVRMRRVLKLLFPSARRVNDQPYLPWCISITEVYQLAEFGEELPRVYSVVDDEIVLADVLQYWQWNADEVVSLVEEVQAGKLNLTSILIGKIGINRWVFKRRELKQWRMAQPTERVNWITIPELAALLGVKQQVAYWLTQNDFIHAQKIGNQKHQGSRVRKRDLDRFLRQYIFGTEIADLIGHSPRKAMNMLKAESIYPIRGTSIEACRQLVYSRSDALDRFIERHRITDPVKWRDTVRKRRNAWERIIQEDGTPVPLPSQFDLEAD